MLETAREFLPQIENYPISEKIEQQLRNSNRVLFILHDQLNLDVFPKELLAQKPLLIFVESLKYATFIPHHKQKLVYILSSQRHFAIACHQQGFPVLNLFTEGFHAEAIADFLAQYPQLKLTYMQT
jgi:deoxyribodipyrimidine photolyase-related protein